MRSHRAVRSRAAYLVYMMAKRSRWPVLMREVIFRLASRYTPVLAVDAEGARFFVSTSDSVVGSRIFARGSFEEDALGRAIDYAGKAGSPIGRQDRVFLDIGANIGTASITVLLRFGFNRAVALEPHPANFELLQPDRK
jgi:hypothetical protein